jgi:hypothetical protein
MSNDFSEPTLFPDGDKEMENLLYKNLKNSRI